MSLKRFDEAKKDFEHVIASLENNHFMVMACHTYLEEIENNQG